MTADAEAGRLALRPRAILFDWDNTLIDSWAVMHHAFNACMAAMGRPLRSLAETKERARHSLRESFPHVFGERWEEAQQIYLDAYRAIHLERLCALPGRERLLHALAEAGFYLGVVSNKTGAVLRQEAAHLGWSGLFGGLVGAGDAAADKPDPAPVRLVLEPSSIPAGEAVWFVGDTGLDMQCAANAGCVPVLLGAAASEEFSRAPPRFVFAESDSLLRFVEGLPRPPAA